jgi:hypothetical protein
MPMTSKPALRRLVDLPGVADLEFKALMKRDFAEPEARAEFPEIDECSLKNFGLTADQADEIARPADWDGIDRAPLGKQVFAFEDAGWDVTDDKRRPLRVLVHFNQQLWLAIRGVAGELPFQAEVDPSEALLSSLARDAERFRKR